MSESGGERERKEIERMEEEPEGSSGPSLKLIYGLMLAAFLAAVAFALAIVLPFHHRGR